MRTKYGVTMMKTEMCSLCMRIFLASDIEKHMRYCKGGDKDEY
jgi:hypothetical protein